MTHYQTEILAPISSHGLYLHYQRHPDTNTDIVLRTLLSLQSTAEEQCNEPAMVIGFGAGLLSSLRADIPGMRRFPEWADSPIAMHATDDDLFIWLKSEERGNLFHRSQYLNHLLAPAFLRTLQTSAFSYQGGRDLTGYEDGTENPVDAAAIDCAFLESGRDGLHGSSFLAVQQWRHDFASFHAMNSAQQDHMIGRQLSDNEELDDAPESAHVKRTAQESFTPEAFLLRRSMPWADQNEAGLYFTAFAHSFDAFEAQLHRMLGLEDGIQDALFQISRPLLSSYFWCPPMQKGRLDLSALQPHKD